MIPIPLNKVLLSKFEESELVKQSIRSYTYPCKHCNQIERMFSECNDYYSCAYFHCFATHCIKNYSKWSEQEKRKFKLNNPIEVITYTEIRVKHYQKSMMIGRKSKR